MQPLHPSCFWILQMVGVFASPSFLSFLNGTTDEDFVLLSLHACLSLTHETPYGALPLWITAFRVKLRSPLPAWHRCGVLHPLFHVFVRVRHDGVGCQSSVGRHPVRRGVSWGGPDLEGVRGPARRQ